MLLGHAQPRRQRPRVFQIAEHESIEPVLISAMMPFAAEFTRVYQALQALAGELDLRCRRADNIWEDPAVVQDVVTLIDRSRVVIADCTGWRGARRIGRTVASTSAGTCLSYRQTTIELLARSPIAHSRWWLPVPVPIPVPILMCPRRLSVAKSKRARPLGRARSQPHLDGHFCLENQVSSAVNALAGQSIILNPGWQYELVEICVPQGRFRSHSVEKSTSALGSLFPEYPTFNYGRNSHRVFGMDVIQVPNLEAV